MGESPAGKLRSRSGGEEGRASAREQGDAGEKERKAG